jgi:hypothetical protein
VHALSVHAERVLDADTIGGDEPVERDRHLEEDFAHALETIRAAESKSVSPAR